MTTLWLAVFLLMARQDAPPQAGPEPSEILQKALDGYAAAKTYQSTWSYTMTRGAATQEMEIEIRAKAPNRVLFRVALPRGKKPLPDRGVPEMLVVLDGQTAWYENTTEKTYFKVQLPKEPKYTPLMFFPQMTTAGPVRRLEDVTADGKTFLVLEADRPEGGTIRMELEAGALRVRRIVSTQMIGLIQHVSSITVKQETFDAEIPDKSFAYKPPRGFKEIPAPPGAAAIFGAP